MGNVVLNKYLKNIGLQGHQIISLPRALTCLGPVLIQYDIKL
jgi:hypothetical protein